MRARRRPRRSRPGRPRDRRTDFATLTESWQARAAELGFGFGFGLAELSRTLGRPRRRRAFGEVDLQHLFDALAAPTGLTRRGATFNRRSVIQALRERLPVDLALDADLLEGLADRFLASSRVVALLPGEAAREERVTFRRRDGRILPVAREEQAYSTPELLAL